MRRVSIAVLLAAVLLAGCIHGSEPYAEIQGAEIVEITDKRPYYPRITVDVGGRKYRFMVEGSVAQALQVGSKISGEYDEDFYLTNVKIDGGVAD